MQAIHWQFSAYKIAQKTIAAIGIGNDWKIGNDRKDGWYWLIYVNISNTKKHELKRFLSFLEW